MNVWNKFDLDVGSYFGKQCAKIVLIIRSEAFEIAITSIIEQWH